MISACRIALCICGLVALLAFNWNLADWMEVKEGWGRVTVYFMWCLASGWVYGNAFMIPILRTPFSQEGLGGCGNLYTKGEEDK